MKWSEEEDRRLLTLISENIHNLKRAFVLFHEEYPNRSVGAVTARWYNKLRLQNDTRVCLFLNTKHTMLKKPGSKIISFLKRVMTRFK